VLDISSVSSCNQKFHSSFQNVVIFLFGNYISDFYTVFHFQNLTYDLGDCTLWEFMFPCNDKPILQVPDAQEDEYDLDEDEVRKLTEMFFCRRFLRMSL
jgi:hypothetical protein